MPFKIGPLELLLMIPVILVGAAVYFLPSILAAVRHRPNTLLIFLLNLLLGWTVLGWIAALVLVFVEPGSIMQSNPSALDLAKARYARGEISTAEFEQIKKNIG